MKISVLIIARNEEKHIAGCLLSIQRQTRVPDEVVLVVHNSSDRTSEIAERFPVRVIRFDGPAGIVAARIKGLESVTGDIICCIDGDSYADKYWVECLSVLLQKNKNVLVGSWVKFQGTVFGWLANWINYFFGGAKGEKAALLIWGPSFAFWGRDRDFVKETYKKSEAYTAQLGLSRNPEDYWLALFMSQKGNLEVTSRTFVINNTKETTTEEAIKRHKENVANARAMVAFFQTIKQSQGHE